MRHALIDDGYGAGLTGDIGGDNITTPREDELFHCRNIVVVGGRGGGNQADHLGGGKGCSVGDSRGDKGGFSSGSYDVFINLFARQLVVGGGA